MNDKYDLVVIGGGPGGIAAAGKAALRKKRVLLIEKDGLGGTCTHRGCIPTKALLNGSKHYADIKKLKRIGIKINEAQIDFPALKKHQQQIVKLAALGAQKRLQDAGAEIKSGRGEIISRNEVKYISQNSPNETYHTENILIAWGSEPAIMTGINLSPRVLTSDGALALDVLPETMIIIGGSFIGVEFATFFAELGVKVTLIELMNHVLPNEDEEAAEFLQQELARAGIDIFTSTKLTKIRESDSGVYISAENAGRTLEANTDVVLICTGRRPVLHNAELDLLGIAYSRAGIKINQNMQTSVSGIYAAGDVTGGMMLAHRAERQGIIAAAHICGDPLPVYDEKFIPSVAYSHPQIAHIGLRQKQAEHNGLTVSIVKSTYSANIIARTELMGQGFVKAVLHQDKIIGATIVGEQAADLIASMSLSVANGLNTEQLRNWIIPHPTLSEIFTELFRK